MFIYTSFSHQPEHPKFRVVLALREPVTDYANLEQIFEHYKVKYPSADKKCFEGSHIFYGGKNLYPLSYENRIEPIESSTTPKGVLGDYDSKKVLKSHTIIVKKTQKSSNNNFNDMIQFIKQRDIKTIHSILNIQPIKLCTYVETYEYIKKQNMNELLNLHGKFKCIFHDDRKPSANIFINQLSGDYLYCCLSSNCSFGTGAVYKVIERLLRCNKLDARRFLRKLYHIELEHTDWQIEQFEMIDENIRYLQSREFPIEYPKQYAIVKKYIPDLVQFWTMVKDYIPPETYTFEQSKLLFYTSIQHFADYCKQSRNTKRLCDRLALFVYFNYIRKLSEEEIPADLLSKAKFKLMENKNKMNRKSLNLISFFEIQNISENLLTFAEGKAQDYKDHHFTMSGWSFDMLHRSLGEDEAWRVYPQMKGKKIKERSHLLTTEMEHAAMNLIILNGWVTEKEIIYVLTRYIRNVSKTALKSHMKKIIGEFVQKYDLIRGIANKKLMSELGIDKILSDNGNASYPYIIYKKKVSFPVVLIKKDALPSSRDEKADN